jgi:cob(I)alamin adenosyltransferase
METASADAAPEYILESDKSGKRAAHKPEELKKMTLVCGRDQIACCAHARVVSRDSQRPLMMPKRT